MHNNNVKIVDAGVPAGFSSKSAHKLFQVKRGDVVIGTITVIRAEIVRVWYDNAESYHPNFEAAVIFVGKAITRWSNAPIEFDRNGGPWLMVDEKSRAFVWAGEFYQRA